jgi:hypothetical protein
MLLDRLVEFCNVGVLVDDVGGYALKHTRFDKHECRIEFEISDAQIVSGAEGRPLVGEILVKMTENLGDALINASLLQLLLSRVVLRKKRRRDRVDVYRAIL